MCIELSISVEDGIRQGLKWKFARDDSYTYFEDNRLCMGLSSISYIFSKFSDFVVRCLQRRRGLAAKIGIKYY